MRYECVYRERGIPFDWSRIEGVALMGVVAGERPRLATTVRACWTEEALRIRFECEDDHAVATMTKRDEPLYEEDVVEVFLDEDGAGTDYVELEVSPRNVVFDALIRNDLAGAIAVDTAWDAEGLETSVAKGEDGGWICEIELPLSNFKRKPADGTSWRWNAYRIDDDRDGNRHFWAWSRTGAVNFHLPRHFGELVFRA